MKGLTADQIQREAMFAPALYGHAVWTGTPPGDAQRHGRIRIAQRATFAASGETGVTPTDGGVLARFGRLLHNDDLAAALGGDGRPVLAPADLAALRGDFAFALWDEHTGALTLVRDQLGTRPLYYVRTPDGVAFATSILALLSDSQDPGAFHMPAVRDIVGVKAFADPGRTSVPDIHAVPPGTRIRITSDRVESLRYWRPGMTPRRKARSVTDFVEATREILIESVLGRIPAGGGVAAHVSGGLDSTTIAAILARHSRAGHFPMPHGYCWQPSPDDAEAATQDQQVFARCLEAFGMEGSAEVPGTTDLIDYLSIDPTTMMQTPEAFLEIPVMRAAAGAGTGVIFSGFLGDEGISIEARNSIRNMVPNALKAVIWRLQGHRRTPSLTYLADDFRGTPTTDPLSWHTATPRNRQIERLSRRMINRRLAGWSMLGAAHNLQYVYPLGDSRLIEQVLNAPDDMFGRKMSRAIMLEVAKGILPEDIRLRASKDEPARFRHSGETLFDTLTDPGVVLHMYKAQTDRHEMVDLGLMDVYRRKLSRDTLKHSGKYMAAANFLLGRRPGA